MIKKICVLFLIVLFVISILAGCGTQPGDVIISGFTVIESGKITHNASTYTYEIMKHDDTGVYYIVFHNVYQAGISVMLNADGTPYMG